MPHDLFKMNHAPRKVIKCNRDMQMTNLMAQCPTRKCAWYRKVPSTVPILTVCKTRLIGPRKSRGAEQLWRAESGKDT